MFDIGASELLLTVIVAIVVIGPKDLPRALRMAGGWIAKIRRVSGHFKSGIEEMIRQAELEDMEKKWREKNEAIMKEEAASTDMPHAASAEPALPDYHSGPVHSADPYPADPHPSGVDPFGNPYPAVEPAAPLPPEPVAHGASPELPLAPPVTKP
jgi:sec-independent protein translocase protein TatB